MFWNPPVLNQLKLGTFQIRKIETSFVITAGEKGAEM